VHPSATSARRLDRARPYLPFLVALPFTVSGAVHIVRPSVFTSIVPRFLPYPTGLVVVSGIAELACAAGLWRRARWAGYASAALLVAIWPANIQDAVSAQHGSSPAMRALLWIRVPAQLPLIWFALQSRRTSAAPSAKEITGT
jgi:uncharacterized membrane protein